MKLTASSIFPQIRARRCCERPVRSNREAISEMVPIPMVEMPISGVEKSRDRRKLIACPNHSKGVGQTSGTKSPLSPPAIDRAPRVDRHHDDGNAHYKHNRVRAHPGASDPVGFVDRAKR